MSTLRCHCRAASAAALKLRARWRQTLNSFCWMNLFPGLIRLRYWEIPKIIRFLKRRNIGFLVTDHNVRETLGICDHAYIVSDGRVLAAGAPSDIIANESVRRVYLGEHFKM